MQGLILGMSLFVHSMATAFKVIPYFFFSLPELVFMAYSLHKMDDHAVLCKVSDVLQSLFERVQGDLRSDSVLLIEDLKARSVVVVRQLQLEFGVGRSEVVLCILEIHDRPQNGLILVLIGVLLSEQLQSDLFAAEEVVYLFELVVARLYLCVVYLVLVLLELVAKRAY